MRRADRSYDVVSAPPKCVTDDEIVRNAIFPLLRPEYATAEDIGMATLAAAMSKCQETPLSFVMWPNGIRAMVTLHPGEDDAAARELLVRTFRAADAGQFGPLSAEVSVG